MSHQLTIEPLGATIEVEEGQTILDAALRQGIYIPHACCHGLCGTCKVAILDGEADLGDANPFALMDFEREEGKALACCATLLEDTVIEADVDEDPDAEIVPVKDFEADVVRIEQLTPTIKAIRLRLAQPMHFQAGQYVQLEIPGLHQSRAFSIANAPADVGATGEIELNVRQVPGGLGTGYLHEKLAAGDRVRLSGPYGRFFARQSAGLPMIFMAGGSGLSSPRSMIHALLECGVTVPITLFYGQRNAAELYYDAEFRALSERYPNFTYVPALSEGAAEAGTGIAHGFVHEVAKAHFDNDFSGRQAYLCGPPVMIDACITTLMQGRLFERDIYHEKFISAADAQQVRSPLFRRV
ncbi:Phenol hydroxylase P5 protein [Paraburkholderia domus]|uniref:NADH:ubiquinone reductase (Na(+)-transporting) subunit F n=1 Tax=Paraburkholderia domus TaxID=2793075 RepID=UPI0019148183|nr:2Fe-2S iron-sulfur cluster binding domain-containing protein [Paraburkholderia domus]MBK5089939.1 2Fe-2S iron-sulfur cluster binding domain-containing protein [Burkholderia sp. R-69927]CAE6910912.1 Phenol hydroxylase P5 protein [Paraburkholderia domus]